MRRFLVAYFAACCAATAGALVMQLVLVLGVWRMDIDVLHDIGSVALIYLVYSLGYTLVLGIVGSVILRALGRLSLTSFLVVGGALGLLAGGVGIDHGFTDVSNPFLYMFPFAGLAAAFTFHRLYYGQVVLGEAA